MYLFVLYVRMEENSWMNSCMSLLCCRILSYEWMMKYNINPNENTAIPIWFLFIMHENYTYISRGKGVKHSCSLLLRTLLFNRGNIFHIPTTIFQWIACCPKKCCLIKAYYRVIKDINKSRRERARWNEKKKSKYLVQSVSHDLIINSTTTVINIKKSILIFLCIYCNSSICNLSSLIVKVNLTLIMHK